MNLLHLTLHNWGVFRDPPPFYLEPARKPGGACHHLTVISGHNGAGKSTLFQVIALALHGSFVLGDRVSRQAYSDFLLSRLHRRNKDGDPAISDEGGVTLSFRYVQSGRTLHVQIERNWHRSGGNVLETLAVLQDGKPPDVDPADYQIWLNDLVPPGLAPLSFFDAEQLDTLANPQQHDGLLEETLSRLLGLDLVERLQADLEYYTLQQGGGQTEHLQEEMHRHRATLDDLDAQLGQLQAEAEALDATRADLEADLAQQEYRLAAEGGTYAARRPILQKRLIEVQEEIEIVSGELRALSAGLLPFALAPGLCRTLSERLVREVQLRQQQIAEDALQGQVDQIQLALQDDELWEGLNVSSDLRYNIVDRLSRTLQKTNAIREIRDRPLVHYLSQPKHGQLQEWIAHALHVVPQQALTLGQWLRDLRVEHDQIQTDLQRAPDDEILGPLHAEIMRLEKALDEVRQQRRSLDEQAGALQFQRDEQLRQLQRTTEQLRAAQANERQLALAERSKLALQVYQDALTRQRLAALERALVTTFNTICRKEHLLAAASIDPDDFQVRLQGADGLVLALGDLSAGERQLYALSLLWALRRVSARRLPLMIDTPLARLDRMHRQRLMQNYVPAVSDQVLLLATDAELDDGLLDQARPYLARIYRLEYDPQQEKTQVMCDEPSISSSCGNTVLAGARQE